MSQFNYKMNSQSLKTQALGVFGQCLFCSSKGKHKNLDKDYYCYGNKEVYQDLIADCFNVQIVSKSACKLICLQCVERLRDALSFKEMVLKAVGKLEDPLSAQGNDKDLEEKEDCNSGVLIKYEDDFDCDYDMSDNNIGSYDEVQHDSNMYLVPGELELLQRFNMAPKALPTSVPDTFRMYLDALKNTVVTSKDVARILKQSEEGFSEQPKPKKPINEKEAHFHNLSTVILYSNATPFRGKNSNGILCFYCWKAFETIEQIREHVQEIHAKDCVKRVLWRYTTEAIKMYVDINNLKCNICDMFLKDLVELKTHLQVAHEKVFYMQYTDRLVPFNMSPKPNFVCLFCEGEYVTFGSLERHMNHHFRNYICKECGNGFITKHRLKVHVTSVHIYGAYPCQFCKKTFSSKFKMRGHALSHSKATSKRFKCVNCNLRFNDYFLRAQHLTDVHGVKPLSYNCRVCDKRFMRGHALTRHIKRYHLENRDFHCDICPYTFYSMSELKQHKVRHTGERVHQCRVCNKSYARLRTLKVHMKIHENNRRFICAVCGQAFVQKCSLKRHLKTHHSQ